LAQALALYSGDPLRSRVVDCLSSLLHLADGDRAAVLWVDDYGAPTVHTHCLLDLTPGRPRRHFEIETLREAWSLGVPGLLDRPDLGAQAREPRSSATVALGSDGTRSWFLAVDSLTPRVRLSVLDQADAFMYQAGRVASMVLHRAAEAEVAGIESGRSGWSVLQDMEQAECAGALGGRIGTRFVVARLVRSALEADFNVLTGGLARQVDEVQRQFGTVEPGDPERESWERIVAAVRAEDPKELAGAVLELGVRVMAQSHLEGAGHLFESAYLVGVAAVLPEPAIDGARHMAIVSRRQGRWDDAFRWYEVGRELAAAYEDSERLGLVLDGLGIMWRLRNDLRRAEATHREVIDLGRHHGHTRVEAYGHGSLAADLRARGKLHTAAKHGWRAFELHPTPVERFRAMMSVAGILRELGDFESARLAYRVVAGEAEDTMLRILALDAVAYLEALRGDESAFRTALCEVDETEWRSTDIHTVATLTYYRGRGFALVGAEREAEEWLNRATVYADEQGTTRIADDARNTLAALRDGTIRSEVGASPINTEEDSEEDLSEIRKALARFSETASISTA